MLLYHPSKGNCWGHAIRPKNPAKAKIAVNSFFETYFEKLEPEWDVTRQLTFELSWRTATLPHVQWAPEFLEEEGQRWQKFIFTLTGNRIMFLFGLVFPLSISESASFDFLRQFSADAPFKMKTTNFRVGIPGKSGELKWMKLDPDITTRFDLALKG